MLSIVMGAEVDRTTGIVHRDAVDEIRTWSLSPPRTNSDACAVEPDRDRDTGDAAQH
jgi:hypothetical protein